MLRGGLTRTGSSPDPEEMADSCQDHFNSDRGKNHAHQSFNGDQSPLFDKTGKGGGEEDSLVDAASGKDILHMMQAVENRIVSHMSSLHGMSVHRLHDVQKHTDINQSKTQ